MKDRIDIQEEESGAVSISVEGYGNVDGDQIVALQEYDGKLEVLIWDVYESPEPLKIVMEDARE